MVKAKLLPLTKFQKEGYWLVVVSRKDELLVAAIGRAIGGVLREAKRLGFKNASVIKSSGEYGLLAPIIR